MLYDHFTPFVLAQLEEFGFCGRGEAKDFIADGAIEMGGRLPINTHGGQLGEAYLHGMNGVAEGVRQVRGTSVNQVDGAEHVLVTGGTGVPTSAVMFGVEQGDAQSLTRARCRGEAAGAVVQRVDELEGGVARRHGRRRRAGSCRGDRARGAPARRSSSTTSATPPSRSPPRSSRPAARRSASPGDIGDWDFATSLVSRRRSTSTATSTSWSTTPACCVTG